MSNMLRIALKEQHDDGRNKLRAVADMLVSKAISGDVQAAKEIADRIEGKAVQPVEHSGDENNPIHHVIKRVIVDPTPDA